MKRKIRIGAINWDSTIPSTTYFGRYTCKALGKPEHRNRAPYYAYIHNDTLDFPRRSLSEYEREMQYAIDAGIDYWAHCWYSNAPIENPGYNKPGMDILAEHICELSYARKLHAQSKLRDKLKMCAIVGAYKLNDEDFAELAREMQKDYYEKIDGRPLVYFFNGFSDEVAEAKEKIRHFALICGTENPYFVSMPNEGRLTDKNLDVDAISSYSCVKQDIKHYSELAHATIEEFESWKDYGKQIIPRFTMGWNPMPRIDSPVPWADYYMADFAPPPTKQELAEGAQLLKDWINSNPDCTKTGHILVFAWNEFEEGGWICPTLSNAGKPDTTILEAFGQIAKTLKAL